MDAIIALTLAGFIDASGPYLVSLPYVGTPTPTHCEFSVDNTKTVVPIAFDDTGGVICKLSVGNVSEGLHLAKARYLISRAGQTTIKSPWNNPRDFFVARGDDVKFYEWDKGIVCTPSQGCSEVR